jgi:hypothetical protein
MRQKRRLKKERRLIAMSTAPILPPALLPWGQIWVKSNKEIISYPLEAHHWGRLAHLCIVDTRHETWMISCVWV